MQGIMSIRKFKNIPEYPRIPKHPDLIPIPSGLEMGITQIGKNIRYLDETVAGRIKVRNTKLPGCRPAHEQLSVEVIFQEIFGLGPLIALIQLKKAILIRKKALFDKMTQKRERSM